MSVEQCGHCTWRRHLKLSCIPVRARLIAVWYNGAGVPEDVRAHSNPSHHCDRVTTSSRHDGRHLSEAQLGRNVRVSCIASVSTERVNKGQSCEAHRGLCHGEQPAKHSPRREPRSPRGARVATLRICSAPPFSISSELCRHIPHSN